jgi:hypothetical protein
MSPSFVPSIKELAGHVNQKLAEDVLTHALTLKTTSQVKRYMAEQMRKLAPDLAMLDMA